MTPLILEQKGSLLAALANEHVAPGAGMPLDQAGEVPRRP